MMFLFVGCLPPLGVVAGDPLPVWDRTYRVVVLTIRCVRFEKLYGSQRPAKRTRILGSAYSIYPTTKTINLRGPQRGGNG